MLPGYSGCNVQPIPAMLRSLSFPDTRNLQQLLRSAGQVGAEHTQQAVTGEHIRRFPFTGCLAPAPGAQLLINSLISVLFTVILQLQLLTAALGQVLLVMKYAVDQRTVAVAHLHCQFMPVDAEHFIP
ncbi:hypothetical protein D3C76_1436140 [compost metagenome]